MTTACDANDALGCFWLAEAMLHMQRREAAEYNPRYDQACDLGEVRACSILAHFFTVAAFGTPNFPRAMRYLLKHCEMTGDRMACYQGFNRLFHNEFETDRNAIAETYRRECNDSQSSGCFNLGVLSSVGYGVPRSIRRSWELYSQACEIGNAGACHFLGAELLKSDRTLPEHPKAIELFREACRKNFAPSCIQMGNYHQHLSKKSGEGSRENVNMAAEFYIRACENGDVRGCGRIFDESHFSQKLLNGPELPVQTLRIGCMNGYWTACRSL